MKPTKKYAKEHKASEGDNRDSAARKTAMPGRGRASIKKGLDDFWKRREQRKEEQNKRARPRGDALISALENPLEDEQKRAIILRYLALIHEYGFSPENAFPSAIGYDLFDKTRDDFLAERSNV